MPVRFSPDGYLDVATDPSDLPETGTDKGVASGAMTRCTNLSLDRAGMATTRAGSSRLTGTRIDGEVTRLHEQAGVRYAFADGSIYRNEANIASGLSDRAWSAISYNPYNVATPAVYALNGVNRKKIENDTVYEWGIDKPSAMTAATADCDILFTHTWEEENAQFAGLTLSDSTGDQIWAYTYGWESDYTMAVRVWTHGWERDYENNSADYYNAYTFIWEYSEYHADMADLWPFQQENRYTYSLPFEASVLDDEATDETTGREEKYFIENIAQNYVWYSLGIQAMWDFEEDESTTAVRKVGTQTPTEYDFLVLWLELVLRYSCVFDWEKALLRKEASIPNESRYIKPMFWFESFDDFSNSYSGVTQFNGQQVVLTYCRYDGETLVCESNPCDPVQMRAYHAPIVVWSVPSDAQVTHVRVYRTLDDGATFLWNSTHPVADRRAQMHKADESLGTQVATDHDRPPLGTIVAGPNFDGVCFIAKGNFLYFCKAKQPEYWPATYYVEIDVPQNEIKSLCFQNGQLHVFTAHDLYLVQGTGTNTFVPLPLNATTGAVGQDAVAAVQNKGIYHLGRDGIYLFSGVVDQRVSDERLRPVFEGTDSGSIPGANLARMTRGIVKQYRNKVYVFYPGGSESYPGNLIVFDLETGKEVHYDYGLEFYCAAVDRTNNMLMAVDRDGWTWKLEDKDATRDGDNQIAWQVRTKEFDNLRRFFPRGARWDVQPVNGATVVGKIYLDGTLLQEHTVTARSNRRRLVATGNGERMSFAVEGTGPATIYSAEVD